MRTKPSVTDQKQAGEDRGFAEILGCQIRGIASVFDGPGFYTLAYGLRLNEEILNLQLFNHQSEIKNILFLLCVPLRPPR